ncbi:MAG: hypothetical protein JOZ65_21335 [Chloroflexi bacterium]|nr:hypothetical protein [Chloroflexota bacterium]
MRHGFSELPDGLDGVLLTESLEHAEHDFVPSGCPRSPFGMFLARNSGIGPSLLGAPGEDDLFAQQLIFVIHLGKKPVVLR